MKIRIYWKKTDRTISLAFGLGLISLIFPKALKKLEAVNQNFNPLGVQSEGESFKGHNEPNSTQNAVFFIGANLFNCLYCVIGRIHETKVYPIDFPVFLGKEESKVRIEDMVVGQVEWAFIFIENVF